MKLLPAFAAYLIIFPLLSACAHAQSTESAVIFSCENAESLDDTDDAHDGEEGAPKFAPMNLSVHIQESAEGLNGFIAEIMLQGKKSRSKDVTVELMKPEKLSHVKAMAKIMLPDLDYSRVKSVRVANVGVRANQRGAGIFLYELRGAAEEPLAKIGAQSLNRLRCGN